LGGTETKKKKLLIVVVTSDRGFCGGFNGNVIKTALSWVKTHQAEYENIDLGFIGKRGHDYFKLKKHAVSFYAPDLGGKVTFLKGRKFADLLVDYYLSGKADEVKIIYNEFKNAISQRIVVENFLPFWDGERGGMAPSENAIGAAPQNDGVIDPMYVFRPNPADVLDALLNRFFAVEAFRILLESQAGEHGARMAAMENATKNADEMIRKLTIIYNKQRQAGITKEILEIIAGSESQNV
jgi:F-type H+-transporting ATPase subunit gamma